MPTEIGQLGELTKNFDLYKNSFSGQLPTEIGGLTALKYYFYAHLNTFTGTLPTQIGACERTRASSEHLCSPPLLPLLPSSRGPCPLLPSSRGPCPLRFARERARTLPVLRPGARAQSASRRQPNSPH